MTTTDLTDTITSTLLNPPADDLWEQLEYGNVIHELAAVKKELTQAKTQAWRTVLEALVAQNDGEIKGLDFALMQKRVEKLVQGDFKVDDCWTAERSYEFTFMLNVAVSGSKVGLSEQEVIDFIVENTPNLKLTHFTKEYDSLYLDDYEIDGHSIEVTLA